MTRTKEIKIRLPVSQHIQLHTLKVTRGIPISQAVEEALTAYFSSDPALLTVDEASLLRKYGSESEAPSAP